MASSENSASLQRQSSEPPSVSSLAVEPDSPGRDTSSPLRYDTSSAPSGDFTSLQNDTSTILSSLGDGTTVPAKYIDLLVSSVLSGDKYTFSDAIDWSLHNIAGLIACDSLDLLASFRTLYSEAPDSFLSTDTKVLKLLSKLMEHLSMTRGDEVTDAINEGGPFAIAIFRANRLLLNDQKGSLERTRRALTAMTKDLEAARRDQDEGLTAAEAEEVYAEMENLEARADYAEKKMQKLRRLQVDVKNLRAEFEREEKRQDEVLRVKEVERREARRMHVKDHAYLMEEIRGLKRKVQLLSK